MTRSATRFLPVLAAALALAAALPAHARNESFLLPVDQALAKKRSRESVGELALRFGSASGEHGEFVPGDVLVNGAASVVSDDPRHHEHYTDEETCQHAFEDAVAQLASRARAAGAVAVVGIVSDFKDQVVDDPRRYDCHAGTAKSYVTLRGKLARTFADASARPLPPATGFAALDDVRAVPISDAGRERYAHVLTLPKPRAFVVYEDGNWRFWSKDPEAMTKALDYCARQGKRCWLYAADDRVVWDADVARRIGASSQLAGAAAAAAPAQDEHQ
jgi:uncharacterized protein YbjQ (UPF0145 family)